MYYNPFPYPIYPTTPVNPIYWLNAPIYRIYPPVNISILESSVKKFQLLMTQGSLLLNRLGDKSFAHKIMTAAQQGKQEEVDQLIRFIGLQIPVTTNYTPTGVNFILSTQTSQNDPTNCCTLTINLKWGR
ncbi:hypothetical protein LRS37_10325 [Neobacillus sedimentimangrovi]|uniref:Uncharacterized protein n=1 Tax=Neobacillus sedimentimangrovi TaxID=2699460 RepID=A0ABS8QKB2_9BACI|nr:hypothetical protein [Neobacillus sedimentimangrovi]MCD4839266.1 hypothetical protein [Neobacillus sedimentimangrovi]